MRKGAGNLDCGRCASASNFSESRRSLEILSTDGVPEEKMSDLRILYRLGTISRLVDVRDYVVYTWPESRDSP
jgi:hypothetical protein